MIVIGSQALRIGLKEIGKRLDEVIHWYNREYVYNFLEAVEQGRVKRIEGKV